MRIFHLALCALIPASLSAAPLDLRALFQKAAESSESLGLAQANVDIATAQKRVAFGLWLPQVAVKAGESFADKGNTEFQSPSVKLNARQDFLTGLDQPAALKGGEAAILAAEADLEQARLDLLEEVGTAYFSVLSLDEEVDAESKLLQAGQEAVDQLRHRVSLGRNRRAELSSAEAQVARVQALVASLEGQRAQAREALASLCHVPVEQELAPLGNVAATVADAGLKATPERLPAVRAAKADLTLAEAGRLAQKGGYLPKLYAEGNWNVARQGGAAGSDWDANLGLELPIFRGGAQKARVDAAEAGVRSAELRLKLAERLAVKEWNQAALGYAQAIRRADANQLALDAAEKSYADQQKDFRNSLVTSLDLLSALQSVENARLEALRSRYDTHRAELRLKLASGLSQP